MLENSARKSLSHARQLCLCSTTYGLTSSNRTFASGVEHLVQFVKLMLESPGDIDTGLQSLALLLRFHGIAVDTAQIEHQLPAFGSTSRKCCVAPGEINSLKEAACGRRVHREIKENPKFAR
jgi:hypothetical protein